MADQAADFKFEVGDKILWGWYYGEVATRHVLPNGRRQYGIFLTELAGMRVPFEEDILLDRRTLCALAAQ